METPQFRSPENSLPVTYAHCHQELPEDLRALIDLRREFSFAERPGSQMQGEDVPVSPCENKLKNTSQVP